MVSANDIFRGTFDKTEIFEITRRTARAACLSWCGTACFVAGILFSSYLFFDLNTGRGLKLDSSRYFDFLKRMNVIRVRPLTNIEVFRWSILISLLFVLTVILWVASKRAQRGTISISNEKISCICERTFVYLMPGQISSVQRNGDRIKIFYLASTLTIKSQKAPQIEDRIKDEYKGHAKQTHHYEVELLVVKVVSARIVDADNLLVHIRYPGYESIDYLSHIVSFERALSRVIDSLKTLQPVLFSI